MKPENVNPRNVKVEKIIFNNQYFSIAYGNWEEEENKQLFMRWNGENEQDKGYPKTFGNPVWFLITEELKIPILTSLLNLKNSKNSEILEILKFEIT